MTNRRQFLGRASASTLATVFAPAALFASANERTFSIGHAEVDISPPLGIELAGFHRPPGGERKITGIRQKTAARALVFQVGNDRAAIVSLDLLGVSADYARQLQARVAAEVGIPADRVRICVTHTHSMPTFVYLRQWGAIPDEYRKATADNVVKAVRLANDDLSPAAFYLGQAACEGGNFNRTTATWKTEREFTKDSTDDDRWLDTTLHVLRFERSSKPDVLWYHFSCHPVCYQDGEAGPDWVGLVANHVREKHGVTPGYLQGHAGDVNPGNGTPWIGAPEPTATAIIAAFEKALAACQTVPVNEMRVVSDTFATPLDVTRFNQWLESYRGNPEACNGGEWVDAGFAKAWFDDNQNRKLDPATHLTPVSVLRLGPLGMLFHGSELYSYYGLRMQKDSPFATTLCVGYAYDFIGYLTDPRAYGGNEYAAVVVPKIADIPPFTPNAARELASFANQLLGRVT